MEKVDSFFIKKSNQNLFLVLILVLTYFPVIIARKTVNIDAQLIMPLLGSIKSPFEYLQMLIGFQTYDIQPVRDLTFFVDDFVFKNFNLNTFIIQNILYWVIACIYVKRILHHLFPSFKQVHCYYLSLLFAIYPLFCATLSWGIARKHILSFMFIMMTTWYFFDLLKNYRSKIGSKVLIHILYLFSILSQPITLLWPLWAWAYVIIMDRKSIREITFFLLPSFVTFSLITYVNYLYYKNSTVFKLYFESKTSDAFNFSDKILGLGHYIYQMFFPYLPATSYQLGHWSVWLGILFLGLFSFVYLGLNLNRKWLVVWFGYLMFPLAIVLSNPHILSDNYLLTPALGWFVLCVTVLTINELKREKFFKIGFPLLLIIFSLYSFSESVLWTDPIKFSEIRNFGRRPNCDSAINLARKSYVLRGFIPIQAKKFLESYECFNSTIPVAGSAVSFIYLQTYIIYYERDISLEKRVHALSKLADRYFYSKLVLATLYFENNREKEASALVDEVFQEYEKINWNDYYDSIMAKQLEPYCRKSNNLNCLKITSHFNRQPNVPYF